jgi:hypothetical protein
MSNASGITVPDDLVAAFRAAQSEDNTRALVFIIEGGELGVCDSVEWHLYEVGVVRTMPTLLSVTIVYSIRPKDAP